MAWWWPENLQWSGGGWGASGSVFLLHCNSKASGSRGAAGGGREVPQPLRRAGRPFGGRSRAVHDQHVRSMRCYEDICGEGFRALVGIHETIVRQ